MLQDLNNRWPLTIIYFNTNTDIFKKPDEKWYSLNV